MDKIKNVAITGGNGFLGSHVVNKLIKEGFKPVLLLRPESNLWRIKDIIQYCQIYTLRNSENDIEKLMGLYQIDCLVHLATDYGRHGSLAHLLKTNVIFPVSLIEEGLKQQLKLFINTDSFFAKSHFKQNYLKDYTNSKRILEKLLIDFSGDLKIANLRIEHVFGENDSEEKFFTSIIRKLLNNDSEIELTAGHQKRDFIYVEDVANAYISVIQNFGSLDKYEEFEIGTGNAITIREFVQKIAVAIGSTSNLHFGALPTREGDIPISYARVGALNKIGWHQVYHIDQAINQIIKKEKERFKL